MVRHIIMFKFTDAKDDTEKSLLAKRMISSFENLNSKIDRIKSYEIGINLKKTDFSYDLIIKSEYDSWEDLDFYIKHPEHQRAINECKGIMKEKAVIDYEF